MAGLAVCGKHEDTARAVCKDVRDLGPLDGRTEEREELDNVSDVAGCLIGQGVHQEKP